MKAALGSALPNQAWREGKESEGARLQSPPLSPALVPSSPPRVHHRVAKRCSDCRRGRGSAGCLEEGALSAPVRVAVRQVAKKVKCRNWRGLSCKEGGRLGIRSQGPGGLGWGWRWEGGGEGGGRRRKCLAGQRGSRRRAGSDLNRSSCRLLAAAAALGRRRTCRPNTLPAWDR